MNYSADPVVDAFLKSIEHVDFRRPEPESVVDRRARLASMLLTETAEDDIESMALCSRASATLQLCMLPDDLDVMAAFVAAKRGYLEAVIACHPL